MYNRTLTEQEQLQNYNFFKFRFGLVPIGWYRSTFASYNWKCGGCYWWAGDIIPF
jgi:hypothetical protein